MQSDRGLDKVEVRNSAHLELSPSLADSDPSGGKAAPAKEPGNSHTHIFSLHSRILTTFTDGKGKKAAKKPDTGKARQKSQPSTSDNKGKRKALADGDGNEAVEDANNNNKTTKPTKAKAKAQKSQTMAKEFHPTHVEDDDDTEDAAVPRKKKMRKLNVNIFGSSKADSLDWANQFNLVSSHILSYDCVYQCLSFREVVA